MRLDLVLCWRNFNLSKWFLFFSKLETFRKVDFSHFFYFSWFFTFFFALILSICKLVLELFSIPFSFLLFLLFFSIFQCFFFKFFYFSNKNAPIFQSRPIIAFKSEFVAFVKPLCCCLQLHQTFMPWQRNLKGKKSLVHTMYLIVINCKRHLNGCKRKTVATPQLSAVSKSIRP